jgi:hypothetical protein
MCRLSYSKEVLRRVSKKFLTETLVKQYYRRKSNRRALNKLVKNTDYYNQVGLLCQVAIHFVKPENKLVVQILKQEEEEKVSDTDSLSEEEEKEEESFEVPVSVAPKIGLFSDEEQEYQDDLSDLTENEDDFLSDLTDQDFSDEDFFESLSFKWTAV